LFNTAGSLGGANKTVTWSVDEEDAGNGLAALQSIIENNPDVVFLDIQMPGMTGLEVLRALPAESPKPYVVFVTGFDEHAFAAFGADAVAYLLKPVQQERLEHVVARVHTFYLGNSPAAERTCIDKVVRTLSPPMRQVVARQRNRFLLLPPAEIVFFRVDDRIVRAFTANDSYWVNFQLSESGTRVFSVSFVVHKTMLFFSLSARGASPDS